MTPIISIIVPTYNHAHYLPSALESIEAQTFEQWEAIVVDDGSVDNPAAVIDRFANPSFHYIRQENQGVAAARNTGIGAARGEYLAFLDADDEWEPRFLQRGLDVLSADDTLAGIYTHYRFIDQNGNVLPQPGGQSVPRTAFHSRLLEGGFFPPHSVLVRAASVREAGLFDTRLSGLADWDLWLRISRRHPMQAIPEFLVRYRVCPGSMSTNASAMHTDRLIVLAKLFDPPQDNPATWPEEKRRVYGFAYRAAAIDYIQQRQADEAWPLLTQAVSIWPGLLQRLDTFYELACGDQPKGYRGQAESLDIAGREATMLKWLDNLPVKEDPLLNGMRGMAYGNAYLALAMLSDQAGWWGTARRQLFRAILASPQLLASHSVRRRLVKLCAGRRLAQIGQMVRNTQQPTEYLTQRQIRDSN